MLGQRRPRIDSKGDFHRKYVKRPEPRHIDDIIVSARLRGLHDISKLLWYGMWYMA